MPVGTLTGCLILALFDERFVADFRYLERQNSPSATRMLSMSQIVPPPLLSCGEEVDGAGATAADAGRATAGDAAGAAGWGDGAASGVRFIIVICSLVAGGRVTGLGVATTDTRLLASISKAVVGTQNDPFGPPFPR